MITVEKFVEGYNKATDKEKFIIKHVIKDKYIPYAEKVNVCNRIVRVTSYVGSGETLTYRQNTPAQYMLYSLNVVDLYTDIDIDFSNADREFDKLDKLHLITEIINYVDDYEVNTLKTLLDMTKDDLMANERDLASFLENKISLIQSILPKDKTEE